MDIKKLTKLVGLKKEEFDQFIKSGQIQVQRANLVPTLKTGDEMALTSIILATIRLVKEFREGIFKDIKFSRGGKLYYYTEPSFPEIDDSSRIDGLIIQVKSGVIRDAVLFEMKNKNEPIKTDQIQAYLDIAKRLKISTLVTVSNEFVSDPAQSPINIRVPKNISLYHFSWTYLLTKGRLLLFKNEFNIDDDDQVEIMKEVLMYLENPLSGVCGYNLMKEGWKKLGEKVKNQTPLKVSDAFISEAVMSWHEKEKDMALLLSRNLGTLVKSSSKSKESLKNDISKIVKENYISGSLSIKNAVSGIKVTAEFERRNVIMSIKVSPPMDKGTVAKITWMRKQLEYCRKKSEYAFKKMYNNLYLEADIKFARDNIKIKLSDMESIVDKSKEKEINAFHITYIVGLGANFVSRKQFIVRIENMLMEYYEGIVQHVSNWKKPVPKLVSSD